MSSGQTGGQASCQVGGVGGQQQAWTGPEDVWLEFIKKTYPHLLHQTYFLPPLHYNLTPHAVDTVAGQVVQVRDNPPQAARPQGRQRGGRPPGPPPASSLVQVAGQVFVANPAHLRSVRVQDSDRQDDEAQHRCLHALTEVSGVQGGQEVMMVISQLLFRKYLDNKTNQDRLANPIHHTRIALLPSIQAVSSVCPNIADGECDILILHHDHGVVVGEIKSVGGSSFFRGQSASDQDSVIAKKVGEAVRQLDRQAAALRCLLQDLPGIRVTRTVLLPNVTSAQLRSALGTSTRLEQDLCRCTDSVDVNEAISRCLCNDFLTRPSAWWQSMWTMGPDPSMSPTLYERLVARFCGPATTVDIPTACAPRKVVRSLGQAVAETGLRFASLVLTNTQVALLNRCPRHLYLQGPPGCGKTVVLFLGALQSAQRGSKVAIVHHPRDVAMAILLEGQLTSILGATVVAATIHLHPCDFGDDSLDVSADVTRLRQELGQQEPDDVHVIIDEVPWRQYDAGHFIPWVTEVGSTWPQAALWMAGLAIRDANAADQSRDRLPSWVEVSTLREPLRCPPHITAVLAEGVVVDDVRIPRYVSPAQPVHSDGPRVRRLQHEGQHGHTRGVGDNLQCSGCADVVADLLIKELCVGSPGHPQYRDVWVLAGGLCPAPRVGDVFAQRLRHQHRLPVSVVKTPLSAADARELALAVTDRMIVTDNEAVQGLERGVVVVLGAGGRGFSFTATSRSNSFLCIVD